MKKQLQFGLVIEGNTTESAVLRVSRLLKNLGPIKSATVRVARRLSSLLRAGYAVEQYEDLQAANLIFLRFPDECVPRIVAEVCASELVLKDMSFVLCESWLSSDVLSPLTSRGASTATLINLPTTQRDWFLVEGLPKAVRQTRRFLERNGVRSGELKAGNKDFLFAAQIMTTALPTPLLLTAQKALRASGFSGKNLSAVLEQMTSKMLKDFLRGARAKWGGPLNECAPEISKGYLRSLSDKSVQMGSYLDEQIAIAKKMMLKDEGKLE